MQLVALELNDFQAHSHIAVDLDHPIVTLVGATDVGKSAVLRALRWLCLNDIAGDEFIREGQKETKVVLRVRRNGDTHEVRRIRGSRINSYELDDAEFKAFGQSSVPSEISSLLRLTEINFQGQHDGPFWFSESAPEVSRKLNAVVDLSVIDTALANIASEVRQAQERKAFVEERLSGAKWDLEKLEPQQERIEAFKSLKEVHEKLFQAKENCNNLEGAITRYLANKERARELEEKSSQGSGLLAAAQAALDSARQESSLRRILSDVSRYQTEAQPPPDFSPVEGAFKEWREREAEAGKLAGLVESCKAATSRAMNAREKLEDAEEEFHLKTRGMECPLCGQIMKSYAKENTG